MVDPNLSWQYWHPSFFSWSDTQTAAALARWTPLASTSTFLSQPTHLCWFSFSQVSSCCRTIVFGQNTWFAYSCQKLFSKNLLAPCNGARTFFLLWSWCFWFEWELSWRCSECCSEASFARDCSSLPLRLGTFCHFLSVASRLCRWRPWNKCWFLVLKLFPFLDICQPKKYSEHFSSLFSWVRPFLWVQDVTQDFQLTCSSKTYHRSKDHWISSCKIGSITVLWQITVAFHWF